MAERKLAAKRFSPPTLGPQMQLSKGGILTYEKGDAPPAARLGRQTSFDARAVCTSPKRKGPNKDAGQDGRRAGSYQRSKRRPRFRGQKGSAPPPDRVGASSKAPATERRPPPPASSSSMEGALSPLTATPSPYGPPAAVQKGGGRHQKRPSHFRKQVGGIGVGGAAPSPGAESTSPRPQNKVGSMRWQVGSKQDRQGIQ